MPTAERFWGKVEFTDDCWLWTGTQNQKGYGRASVQGRAVQAHRWAYEFCVGPIPDGLTIDHLCRVRNCVNPDHLEPVTNRVNLSRGFSPSAICARKTHCPQGHPYSGDNLYVKPNGWRECRICATANKRRAYLRFCVAIGRPVSAPPLAQAKKETPK